MKGVIDNEYKIIEELLESTSSDWSIGAGKVVLLLAKHYYSLEGRETSREVIFNHINNFIKERVDKYSPKKWSDLINNVIDTVIKNEWYEPIKVDKIEITRKEWEKIIELDDNKLERVAFIILCYVKLYKARRSSKDRVDDLSYILTEASCRGVIKDKLLIADLRDKGYVQIGNLKHMYVKPLYIYEDSEPYIIIDNFDKVITYYDEYRNNVKYRECTQCGKRIKVTNNKKKYCSACAKIEKNKKTLKSRK